LSINGTVTVTEQTVKSTVRLMSRTMSQLESPIYVTGMDDKSRCVIVSSNTVGNLSIHVLRRAVNDDFGTGLFGCVNGHVICTNKQTT